MSPVCLSKPFSQNPGHIFKHGTLTLAKPPAPPLSCIHTQALPFLFSSDHLVYRCSTNIRHEISSSTRLMFMFAGFPCNPVFTWAPSPSWSLPAYSHNNLPARLFVILLPALTIVIATINKPHWPNWSVASVVFNIIVKNLYNTSVLCHLKK